MEKFLFLTTLVMLGLFRFSMLTVTTDTFEEDALLYHNAYRGRHRVPPLKLNTTLSEMAADWASKVAQDDRIQTSSISNKTDIKENLCMACGFNFTVYDVTLEWYLQACNYDFQTHQKIPAHVGEVENFQSMVWKSAMEMGIGRAKSKHLDCNYIVSWYNPINGNATENVFKGDFKGTECPQVPRFDDGGQYLNDNRRGIFLCGGSAELVQKKACEHFGCTNGRFLRQN